jgi:hypothetical protein
VSAELERRYARLLRLYPADYRRARGAELLETLMESAEEGRKRPAAREVGALILGALRAHAGRDRRQSMQDSWLVAFQAAALMLFVYDLASRAVVIALDFAYGGHSIWSPTELALNLVALALGTYALIAGARGRYRSAIAAASMAFVVTLAVMGSMQGTLFNGFWGFPLAVVLLVPLLRHRPPSAAGLVKYAPMLPLLLVLAEEGLPRVFPGVFGILLRGFVLALWLGGLLWLAVDERLTMALGLLLLNTLLVQVALIFESGIRSLAGVALAMVVTGFMPTVLLLASAATARQRAKI